MLQTRANGSSGGARGDTFGASSDTRSPEQERELFGSSIWDHVSSLRLLIQTLQKLPEVRTINAQEIRNCEVGVRSLLEKETYYLEEYIKRNRARLKVFDIRVGEGIQFPRWLDLELLNYTLDHWQRRLLVEHPHVAEQENPRVNLSHESAEVIFQSWREHYNPPPTAPAS
jgi:hypothetical protein